MVGRTGAQYIWKNNQRKQGWLKFLIIISGPSDQIFFWSIWPKKDSSAHLTKVVLRPMRSLTRRRSPTGWEVNELLGEARLSSSSPASGLKVAQLFIDKVEWYLSVYPANVYTTHSVLCYNRLISYQLSSNQCFENQRKPAFSVLPLGSEMSGDFHTCATRTVEVWFSYL